MALSVRLTAKDGFGQELWAREPAWWNANRLWNDPRKEQVDHVDWQIVMPATEAREWQGSFRSRALDWMAPKVAELDQLLEKADQTIEVLLFEWGSS